MRNEVLGVEDVRRHEEEGSGLHASEWTLPILAPAVRIIAGNGLLLPSNYCNAPFPNEL